MNTEEKTKQAMVALAKVVNIMIEAVEEAGTMGIPSGHLYLFCQQHLPQVVTNIDRYNVLVDAMVKSGRVTLENHLLRAKR